MKVRPRLRRSSVDHLSSDHLVLELATSGDGSCSSCPRAAFEVTHPDSDALGKLAQRQRPQLLIIDEAATCRSTGPTPTTSYKSSTAATPAPGSIAIPPPCNQRDTKSRADGARSMPRKPDFLWGLRTRLTCRSEQEARSRLPHRDSDAARLHERATWPSSRRPCSSAAREGLVADASSACARRPGRPPRGIAVSARRSREWRPLAEPRRLRGRSGGQQHGRRQGGIGHRRAIPSEVRSRRAPRQEATRTGARDRERHEGAERGPS
jgi:hypothetical protein